MRGHTKGPWEWRRCEYGALWLRSGDDYVIWYEGCGSHSAEVEDADARIIEAAPDLLGAAESAKDLLERLGMMSSDAHAELESAIAKAKGEQHG